MSNIYDELLSYKIKEGDLKLITDLFILLQKNKKGISLKDLLFFYNKKINFANFKKIIEASIKNKIDIPFETLKKVNLSGNDFLNFIEGVINAKKEEFKIEVTEIEYFAKMKINIPEVIKSLKLIKKYEPDIKLSDFITCKNCLNDSKNTVNEFIKLKENDKNITLKSIISIDFRKNEISKIIQLYKQLKPNFRKITLKEIIEIKSEGINTINLLQGMVLAQKNNKEIPATETLVDIAKLYDFNKVIEDSITPEIKILKPVNVILSSGVVLLLKLKYMLFAQPENYVKGIKKTSIIEIIKKQLKEAAKQYATAKDFMINASEICLKIENHINGQKPAYTIHNLDIQDFIIERDIVKEQENAIDKQNQTENKSEKEQHHKTEHNKHSSHHH